MTTSVHMSVDPVAFRELRGQLFAFDRTLLGKLNSRLRRAVEPARSQALGSQAALGTITHQTAHGPELSGIARTYLDGPKSITVKVGGRTSSGGLDAIVRLKVGGKAQGMAEFARSSTTPQGAALVSMLSRRFGSPGRFAWQAVDDHETQILDDIRAEIRKTEAEFSTRLAAGASAGVLR